MKPRRNKGPEHIREILKSVQKEWQESVTQAVKDSRKFKEMEQQCPGFIQIAFLYIEGDPQYIRTIILN